MVYSVICFVVSNLLLRVNESQNKRLAVKFKELTYFCKKVKPFIMHSKVYTWVSPNMWFWFMSLNLGFLIITHWMHTGNQFWCQISISQVCNFPSTGGGYLYAWCWKSQLFLASWFLVISIIDWTRLIAILVFLACFCQPSH